MDDVVHRLARELADAIGSSVAEDPKVEACREKARAAGYEMQISLEAVIGFGSRDSAETLAKATAPAKAAKSGQLVTSPPTIEGFSGRSGLPRTS